LSIRASLNCFTALLSIKFSPSDSEIVVFIRQLWYVAEAKSHNPDISGLLNSFEMKMPVYNNVTKKEPIDAKMQALDINRI